MRKRILAIAALGTLTWISAAWAIIGETSVTATDGGMSIPGATVTFTFKTDTGKTIRKVSTMTRFQTGPGKSISP
jgi:hypothetical protein